MTNILYGDLIKYYYTSSSLKYGCIQTFLVWCIFQRKCVSNVLPFKLIYTFICRRSFIVNDAKGNHDYRRENQESSTDYSGRVSGVGQEDRLDRLLSTCCLSDGRDCRYTRTSTRKVYGKSLASRVQISANTITKPKEQPAQLEPAVFLS